MARKFKRHASVLAAAGLVLGLGAGLAGAASKASSAASSAPLAAPLETQIQTAVLAAYLAQDCAWSTNAIEENLGVAETATREALQSDINEGSVSEDDAVMLMAVHFNAGFYGLARNKLDHIKFTLGDNYCKKADAGRAAWMRAQQMTEAANDKDNPKPVFQVPLELSDTYYRLRLNGCFTFATSYLDDKKVDPSQVARVIGPMCHDEAYGYAFESAIGSGQTEKAAEAAAVAATTPEGLSKTGVTFVNMVRDRGVPEALKGQNPTQGSP